ncbi:MAG: SLC13/DASS family transporter [Verrucomicrobiae bacterium]|nr:SLC13/DASS family transporter [Verrucomicrobiae bacterium]
MKEGSSSSNAHEVEGAGGTKGIASTIGFWLGLAAFLGLLIWGNLEPDKPAVSRMAAIAALMAIWWITDAIPLAATALVPLVAFPVLGIMSSKETAPIYVNDTIFLFVGGFMIALAMERWNLHRRIALRIIQLIGSSPARLVLSFMVASAFLSMWISNTATAIMMLAIGMAIVAEEEKRFGTERTHKLTVALLLGIAYACSVGGMATLVGTPPNLSFVRLFAIAFPDTPPEARVGFAQWMLLGVPVMLIMLTFIWLLLTQVFFRSPGDLKLASSVIRDEYRALGPIRFSEGSVMVVFAATALLWVFRKDLTLGEFTLPGWSRLLPAIAFDADGKSLLDDGTIAIAMALLLFLIPSRSKDAGAPDRVLDFEVFRKIPWHIVLLFGGGFALASGFKSSGLSEFIGEKFAALAGSPPLTVVAAVSGTLTFMTELTSNTATTEMAMPILASVAVAMKTHPYLLMIPATLSASCAFMMPVATPPNAIVFGSGRLRILDMVKIGFFINLIGIIVITGLFYTIGFWAFHIDPAVAPAWSAPAPPPAAATQ